MKAKQTKNSTNARRVNESNMIHSIKIEEIVVSLLLLLFIPNLLVAQSFDIDRNSIGIMYKGKRPIGTGFICQYPNLITTCAHIFEDENKDDSFIYRTTDGDFSAELLYSDDERDIAVLRVSDMKIEKPLALTKDFSIHKGTGLVLMGYDHTAIDQITVSPVKVIEFNKQDVGKGQQRDLIGFYGIADHGYSGGPVFKWNGEVYALIIIADFDNKNPENSKESFNVAVILEDLSSILDSLSKNERSK